MAGDKRLTARFGSDTSDFQNGIRAINREMKLVESGFKATASTMDDWSNNATGLEARMKALNKTIDLQKEKVEALRNKQEQLAKAHGENSVEAQNAGIEFNKESVRLNNLQKELGQTEYSLKGLKNESTGVRGVFKGMGTQLDTLKQQFPQLGAALSLFTNPLVLATAAVGAFAAASKKSIEKTVAYNEEIRKTMELTGLSAEETSRFIQVADDCGVEIGTARNAMELMNKKGITPSIENMALLADQYVAATDKAAFMEEASKKYGKSIGDLIPLMTKGGDALRKNADAIDDSMLATNASIKASRDWKLAVDNLGDSVEGLGYKLGNKLLPPATRVINALTDLATKTIDNFDAHGLLMELYERGMITQDQLAKSTRDLRFGTKDLAGITAEYWEEVEKLNNILAYNSQIEKEELIRRGKLTIVTEDQAEAIDEAAIAQEKYRDAMSDLSFMMSGRITDSNENFAEQQKTITDRMAEIRKQIGLLNISDMLTPEQFEELQTLQGEYDTLAGKYEENADEHEKATKRIILDLLIQEAAEQGLVDSDVWVNLAQKWGLISEAEAVMQKSTDDAITWLAKHPGDIAGMELILQGVNEYWLGILTNMGYVIKSVADFDAAMLALDRLHPKIVVDVEYNTANPPPGGWGHVPIEDNGEGPGGAHGLDMIVPQNFPNDTFPIRASSGERVIVIPPEFRGGAGSGSGIAAAPGYGITPGKEAINITINGAPDNEMQMRRMARYVVDEIKRRQI